MRRAAPARSKIANQRAFRENRMSVHHRSLALGIESGRIAITRD